VHVDQGNHGLKLPTNTPTSDTGYIIFKSLPNIFFPNNLSYNFPTSSPNPFIKPNLTPLCESYSLNTLLSTMSQPSTQTSPTKTSPQKPSPSKSTTTTPNVTENPSVPLPQPSDVITNATPLPMIHPAFNSILNPTPSNPSPSPKSKPTKNTKSVTTRKPKSQKSKSRYSSNFDMQQLYLNDLGNARTNVASDVATPCPDVQIEANKEDSTQTLSPKKGETAKMGEQYVPNTPSDEGDDEDAQNIKIAEDALKSLVDSVSGVKVVTDVPTSLAQDQPQADVMDDSNVQQNDDIATDVIGDPSVQPDEIVADDVLAGDTDQVDDAEDEGVNEDDSTDEDVTILEIVGES
jgi:hypothetical protein